MKILVINSGSSSIKYKLFIMPGEHNIAKGIIEHIGEKDSKIKDHYMGLKIVLGKIKHVDAVGHRVVHGAEKFKKPILINASVIRKIRQCCSLAPLHNPANLAGILACKKLLPGIRQIAVFDTAFHQTLPDYAYIYGLPYEYYKRFGVRKYGFHGTSHQYVASEAARRLNKQMSKLKIITCHLGNGCSIAAVEKGRSIDTSMGFTPLEGLIMGTRCGDIDPALVTYIMHKKRLDIFEIDSILNKASGLKGISGISNDMRILESKARLRNKRAKLAVDIFIYRIKKYIGAYTAIMAGCDALIFTGGIGENQTRIRNEILKGIFSHLKKKPKILVIPTDEELMIARQTYKLVKRD
ncbi:MAG: acetate kinase [Candidatus Omnitrophica bacterium CG23_combo_of_CG06-09_8_20_14_all_40_11]|nr:MAG: acetate kinase [Candidatus Omnitrophica bacterium CG23_combo_of_CG06-09_8_20_14_all_40_11]